MLNNRFKTWAMVAGIVSGTVATGVGGAASAAPTKEVTETNTPTSQTKAELVHATAKVKSINHAARTVTLLRDDGEEATIYVPADVKAYDKLKVGDKIDIDYYEALAITVMPSGSKPSITEKRGRAVDMGGGVTGRETTVAAEVVSVDVTANLVTFKGPKGRIQTVHVMDPANQQKLPMLKPGQVVQFDYKEATAATIRPAAK